MGNGREGSIILAELDFAFTLQKNLNGMWQSNIPEYNTISQYSALQRFWGTILTNPQTTWPMTDMLGVVVQNILQAPV